MKRPDITIITECYRRSSVVRQPFFIVTAVYLSQEEEESERSQIAFDYGFYVRRYCHWIDVMIRPHALGNSCVFSCKENMLDLKSLYRAPPFPSQILLQHASTGSELQHFSPNLCLRKALPGPFYLQLKKKKHVNTSQNGNCGPFYFGSCLSWGVNCCLIIRNSIRWKV